MKLNEINATDKTSAEILEGSSENFTFDTLVFPISESERSGIEDARFVRFVDDNDEATYYVTGV
ncbi:MAG: hypothetical protein PHY16_18275 [Methylobacter sp.]|nr:hypothetical protein [Methylobacter sp.]